MTDIRYIQSTERQVGEGHPTLADTLNRALRDILTASGLDPDAAFTGFMVGQGLTGTGSPEGAVTANVGASYQQKDATVGRVWWAKVSGTGNTGWKQVPTDGMGTAGVGGTNFSILSRLVLGAATATSDDTAIIVARAMVGSLAGAAPFSAHAFRDETTMNSSVDGGTYASVDAAPTYTGTTAYNHLHAVQSRPTFNGSGTLTTLAGFENQTVVSNGTVANAYGVKVVEPSGAGAITNSFGYYCDYLIKGAAKNFAFYSTGPTKSSFGGSLNLGTVLKTGATETPDTSVAILISNTDLTGTAQAGINSGATASATATTFWGMIAKAAAGAATLANAYGLNILTATKGAGSVATNYGLKVEDQTVGSSNNYSVYTGVGKVFFGDMVYGLRLRARSVTSAASPYTIVSEDTTLLTSAFTGAVTLNLPTATGNQGRILYIKKTDTGTNAVTITPNGADTIDGAATWVLSGQYEYVTLKCDGTATWSVVSSSRFITQTAADNSTKAATTAYVDRATTHTGTTSASPTGTTSATAVMMGLAGSITPTRGTKIIFMASGQMANDTVNDGATVDLRYGTGAAPSNGAAVTGTVAGIEQTMTSLVAAQRSGFHVVGKVTGLSVGTAYWFDLSLKRVTGGTASVTGCSLVAFEVP